VVVQAAAPWLEMIFRSQEDGGLGLTCPVIMVHGNHEGFAHLEQLTSKHLLGRIVESAELPGVDTNAHIRLLPSAAVVALSQACGRRYRRH